MSFTLIGIIGGWLFIASVIGMFVMFGLAWLADLAAPSPGRSLSMPVSPPMPDDAGVSDWLED